MTVLVRMHQELKNSKSTGKLIFIQLRSGKCIRGRVGDVDDKMVEILEREFTAIRRHFIFMSAIDSIEIMDEAI